MKRQPVHRLAIIRPPEREAIKGGRIYYQVGTVKIMATRFSRFREFIALEACVPKTNPKRKSASESITLADFPRLRFGLVFACHTTPPMLVIPIGSREVNGSPYAVPMHLPQ